MNTESWIALSSVVGILAAALLGFWGWKRRLLASLRAGSRIAETSRGSVEYALSGQGFVVLYFHGTVGGYDQGLAAASFINGRDEEAQFTILAPSRPGYLRTPVETGRTPEQQADAMAALLDYLGIDKVAAIGASGGGPFALQFVLRHPERASALVMFSAIARRIPPHKRAGVRKWFLSSRGGLLLLDLFLSTLMHLMLRFRIGRLAQRLFRGMTVRTVPDSDIRNRVAAMLANLDQVRFFRALVGCMLPLSARAAGVLNDEEQIALLPDYPLERIQAPTLIVQGLEDCAASPSHVKFVADKVPGAEVYAIERCGHFIWVGEHSQRMRAALVEFLRKHAASGLGAIPN
ncbi:MAG TPA: alpha/beta hydrolase [Gemmataceae bacterium]|jgi:pimeloyl-ACP methyl ester carboxylesterase